MRGLVTKDIYVLTAQLKVFAILMIVMAAIPNTFTRGFAIMYASMLPVTALAFDEQAKWDYYAAMMPYRKRDLVISKYIIGILFTFITSAVVVLSIVVTTVINHHPIELMLDHLLIVPLVAACAMILMSLNLPIIFKMGAEKGRLVYIVLTMIAALAVVRSVQTGAGLWEINERILLFGLIAIAIVILLLSIVVSIKIYNHKRS